MLGAAAAAFQGQAGAASTYTSRVRGYSPNWYLPLGDTMATALVGPSGTYVNSPQLEVDPIAQDDPGGRSAGFSGATVETPHVTVSSPLIGPDLTIDLIVQLDDLSKAKHVLITTTGGSSNGQFSLEVLKNGQVRAWSVAGGQRGFSWVMLVTYRRARRSRSRTSVRVAPQNGPSAFTSTGS